MHTLEILDVDVKADTRIALWIKVHQEHPIAFLKRKAGTKINRGRRLSCAALVIGDGDDSGHVHPPV